MTTQQTVWPCFPLTLPYELTFPGHTGYGARGYPGMLMPSRLIPLFNTAIEKSSAKEIRKFFLDRSLFDLVEAHPYLPLTDRRLMSWYLCLSAEDRQILLDEGGFHQFLQRHPALELSRHHVYVKYNNGSTGPLQQTITSNKHKSRTPGAKTCRCEMPHTHLELETLHSNVRENLTPLGCSSSRDGSQKQPQQKVCGANRQIHLQDSPITQELSHQRAHMERSSPLSPLNENKPSWPITSSEDPAALASFSLDMELEQWEKPELRSQSANFTYAEVSALQATMENKSSEYYSFDSTEIDGGENNRSMVQVNCPLGPADERSTIEGCQDYMVCGNDYTVDNNEANLSLDDESDNFHSIMEEDESILVCVASEGRKTRDNGVHSGPVGSDSEALTSASETTTTSEKYTSPLSCVPTCDVMISTELTPCTSAFTQSEDPETADKNVITEVHMADLDYLAGEFIKIKMTQEKQTEQREKSTGCRVRKECDCAQRAQQAELCLLALQYSICRQHCWRLYYTSAEGGLLSTLHGDMNQCRPQQPPANISSVLQKLESDYNQMRNQILEGVPLEQLQPLSLDTEKITAGASYIPAQIVGNVLENLSSWSSLKTEECNPTGEEDGGPRNGRQDSQRQEKRNKKETSKARRAVILIPQDRGANHAAACKELNTSEAWYDAEEDLEPAGPAVAAETRQDVIKGRTNESSTEEAKSSVLCVSNLPSNVTESDVMLWFEKHCPSEVHICVLKDDSRVAIVIVSGTQSAGAAVRGLNGFSVEGHTLHVEHVDGAVGGSRSQVPQESSQDAATPLRTKADPRSTEGKLPSLGSSIKQRKVVSISPTAKGTCVPQHYGTMGSFDTLMAELTRLHPDVGRQRIVEALMELRAEHQGILSGLPLRTIREMTSELLARPGSAPQL